MATVDLPLDRAFLPASMSFGSSTSKAASVGYFSGDRQSLSNLSDRLLATLQLGPVKGNAAAGRRSAFLMALDRSGDYLRFGPLHRRALLGTLSGAITVNADVLGAASSLVLAGGAVGATLLAGDIFGIGGNLLQVGYAGAVADGAGHMTVPLTLPPQRPIAAGAAVVLSGPTGLWQLDTDGLMLDFSPSAVQLGISLPFRQKVA